MFINKYDDDDDDYSLFEELAKKYENSIARVYDLLGGPITEYVVPDLDLEWFKGKFFLTSEQSLRMLLIQARFTNLVSMCIFGFFIISISILAEGHVQERQGREKACYIGYLRKGSRPGFS